MPRRSRPGRVAEETIKQDNGVELVVVRNPNSNGKHHTTNYTKPQFSLLSDSIMRETRKQSLPVLDTTDVFEVGTSLRLEVGSSNEDQQPEIMEPPPIMAPLPAPVKKKMDGVKIVDYVFCVCIHLNS